VGNVGTEKEHRRRLMSVAIAFLSGELKLKEPGNHNVDVPVSEQPLEGSRGARPFLSIFTGTVEETVDCIQIASDQNADPWFLTIALLRGLDQVKLSTTVTSIMSKQEVKDPSLVHDLLFEGMKNLRFEGGTS